MSSNEYNEQITEETGEDGVKIITITRTKKSKYSDSMKASQKRYAEKNRGIINEEQKKRNKAKYHTDPVFKEKALKASRKYDIKRKERKETDPKYREALLTYAKEYYERHKKNKQQ